MITNITNSLRTGNEDTEMIDIFCLFGLTTHRKGTSSKEICCNEGLGKDVYKNQNHVGEGFPSDIL